MSERAAYYLRNVTALYVSDADLAARVEALPFCQTPPLERSRDGQVTVRLTADDGQAVYAHSRYRPLEEADAFAATQSSAEQPVFVISGLGLGYHVQALEQRYDRPLLVVAEDDVGLIKAALSVVDLSGPLVERRLIFLTALDKGALHARLARVHTDLLLGLRFVELPHAGRVHRAFHAGIRGLVRDFISFAHLQMVTLLRNARITFQNVAFNLPSYLAHPGVEMLAGRAAGRPAIVIAAGPSLARHLDELPALRDRAVLIAVQTVFKLLLARGTPPHFVTSLDFHEVSRQFFHGLTDVGGAILVAEPKATWHVLDEYPGRMHILHSPFYDDLLREVAPHRAALKAGSTVAHLAFYLAQHLGCDPIILVGQDLAFSEGLYYPPGTPIEKTWQCELGRFYTLEMKQWERIVRGRPILRTVKDVRGRDTYTDDQLLTYAEQFQSDFAACRARVIHASESGLRLLGTEVMPLRTAAERFCTQPLGRDLFAAGATGATPVPLAPDQLAQLQGRACAALKARLEELRGIKAIASEMSGLLEKLSGLVERPAEFNRVMVRVDDLRTRVQHYGRTYKLVVEVSQLAELRRHTADRRIGDLETETPQTARRRLQRDREYVAAFIESCDWLEDTLPQAIQRVRERCP